MSQSPGTFSSFPNDKRLKKIAESCFFIPFQRDLQTVRLMSTNPENKLWSK